MERYEHQHALIPEDIRVPPFVPAQPALPPKTRCSHCCFQYAPYSSDESRHSAMTFCNGNFCTQTCFSSLQRYSRLVPQTQASCSCHSSVPFHARILSHPQTTGGCRCCQRRQSSMNLPSHVHHHLAHAHLTTDNLTYPSPHYATAYAPHPGLHHSWEPTTGYREREYHLHMESSPGASAHEYHSHVHHHVNHHGNSTPVCTYRGHIIRDQSLYTLASRHYRRHSSRLSPYPIHSLSYPLGDHNSVFPSLPPGFSMLPPRPLIPTAFDIDLLGELEVEPLENDWQDGHPVEPKGLTKEQIRKLPSYIVTKKTMEEFTENERCVVCMCEFDVEDKLRILPCAHEFHVNCVDKWLTTNPTCPICRAVVDMT